MTDQRDSVTAGEYLTGLEKVLTEENAALRRERDEARETDDGWKPLHAEIEALRADIAKKDAALREAREMVETRCMCASACVCGAVRQRIDQALAPAAQGEWVAKVCGEVVARRPAPAPSAGETVLVPREPTYKQLAWIANTWTCTIEEAAETYGDLIDFLAAAPTTGEPT